MPPNYRHTGINNKIIVFLCADLVGAFDLSLSKAITYATGQSLYLLVDSAFHSSHIYSEPLASIMLPPIDSQNMLSVHLILSTSNNASTMCNTFL